MFLKELAQIKNGAPQRESLRDRVTINPHAQSEPRQVRRAKLKRESKSPNIEDRKIRKV